MKLNRKKMVMESIIPPCNTGKIPSVTQDSVESLTDFLKKKMKDCSKKTRKDREEELVYGDPPWLFRYLLLACLPEKEGKDGGLPEALSVVTRHFPEQIADGRQVRALLSKRIKEGGDTRLAPAGAACGEHLVAFGTDVGLPSAGEKKEKTDHPGMSVAPPVSHSVGGGAGREAGDTRPAPAGAACGEHPVVFGTDVGLPPAGEKKEKTDHPGTSVAPPVPHPVGRGAGHSLVLLIQSRTETPVPEMAPSFLAPSEMTEKGEALVYRFRTWGREASVCIQPQHGGAMMLQPSDVAVEQRLVAHWPAGQQRHWYLASDEQGARNYYQPNRDDEEET
ncbi:TPA: type III secretion system needle length determinant, SpaN/EivJ family [Escherichia coli]